MSNVVIGGIFVISLVGILAICLCVFDICDAWKHKYTWMYEGHQERDERFEHEREMKK